MEEADIVIDEDEYMTITAIYAESQILYCDVLHDHKLMKPLEIGTIIRINKPQEFYYKGNGIYTRPRINVSSSEKNVKIVNISSFTLEGYVDSWLYIYRKQT